MNRMTNLLAGFLLTITPLALGQEPQSASQFPEDAITTRQLIAWSRLQEPQPTPQPRPPRDNRIPQPDQQGQQGNQLPDPPTPQEQAPVTLVTQAFSGKIIYDGNQYVLRMAGNMSYELEGSVGQYENQSVRVTGNLYKNTNLIRVVRIELLS
jgi:Protein of unknown function (DUF5818)